MSRGNSPFPWHWRLELRLATYGDRFAWKFWRRRQRDREWEAFVAEFSERQEPLGADFEKVWDDNAERLYEK